MSVKLPVITVISCSSRSCCCCIFVVVVVAVVVVVGIAVFAVVFATDMLNACFWLGNGKGIPTYKKFYCNNS